MNQTEFGIPFILLAEDDDNDAFGMELAFQKAGLSNRVKRVCNGQQAINYLEGRGEYADRARYPLPSMLLMDWHMPCKKGFEVLQWLREHPVFEHLVVIVLTGSAEESDKKKAYDLRANSYLVKPNNFKDFVHMLTLLDGYWGLNHVPSISATPDTEEPRNGPSVSSQAEIDHSSYEKNSSLTG